MENQILKDFTTAPNQLINDDRLSPQARFLFVWLASKPPGWKYYNNAVCKALGVSDDTRRKYMNELALAGWLSKTQKKSEGGKWQENDIVLNPYPKNAGTAPSPTPKNTAPEKNGTGKSAELSNTNLFSNNDSNSNNEIPLLPKEIIAYLNLKRGGQGFHYIETNYTEIKARIKQKVYTRADFFKVIDAAIIKWKDDPVNKKFLRPETLFGTKFNGYLVEADDIINGVIIQKNENEPNANNTKTAYVFDAISIIEQQTSTSEV